MQTGLRDASCHPRHMAAFEAPSAFDVIRRGSKSTESLRTGTTRPRPFPGQRNDASHPFQSRPQLSSEDVGRKAIPPRSISSRAIAFRSAERSRLLSLRPVHFAHPLTPDAQPHARLFFSQKIRPRGNKSDPKFFYRSPSRSSAAATSSKYTKSA